jgi:hypothetical protein
MLGSVNNQPTAEGGEMKTILQNSAIDKLPMKELTATLDAFMEPVLTNLPGKRLREVAKLAVQGVIGGAQV